MIVIKFKIMAILTEEKIKSALFGLVVGDALGVPAEFKSRKFLDENPITEMIGYGTHKQPKGTWSDDSAMTFITAESLANAYNLKNIADLFLKWKEEAYWNATDEIFDIGISTLRAIDNYKTNRNPLISGNYSENSNGNGSLMRILPLAFYTINMNVERRFEIIKEVSSITHAHIRSVISCFYYVEYAISIIKGEEKLNAYYITNHTVNAFFDSNEKYIYEKTFFDRILSGEIYDLQEDDILSSGYVIDSLEAALWCFFKNDDYKSTVLNAVNLGEDTDTIAAIVGGLAGIYYGFDSIPENWINSIAKKNEIEKLCNRFYLSM